MLAMLAAFCLSFNLLADYRCQHVTDDGYLLDAVALPGGEQLLMPAMPGINSHISPSNLKLLSF